MKYATSTPSFYYQKTIFSTKSEGNRDTTTTYDLYDDQYASGLQPKQQKSCSVYVKVPNWCRPTDTEPSNLIKIEYFIKVN